MADKSEIYCRFIKTTTLKGKSDQFRVYKAFWNPTEIEIDIKGSKTVVEEKQSKGMQPAVKAFLIIVPIIIILIVVFKMMNSHPADETRSKQHRVTVPTEPGK
jgi:hypothetical protein